MLVNDATIVQNSAFGLGMNIIIQSWCDVTGSFVTPYGFMKISPCDFKGAWDPAEDPDFIPVRSEKVTLANGIRVVDCGTDGFCTGDENSNPVSFTPTLHDDDAGVFLRSFTCPSCVSTDGWRAALAYACAEIILCMQRWDGFLSIGEVRRLGKLSWGCTGRWRAVLLVQ